MGGCWALGEGMVVVGGGLEGGWGDERSADKLVSCLGGFLISAPPGPLLPFRSVLHLLLTSSFSERKKQKECSDYP